MLVLAPFRHCTQKQKRVCVKDPNPFIAGFAFIVLFITAFPYYLFSVLYKHEEKKHAKTYRVSLQSLNTFLFWPLSITPRFSKNFQDTFKQVRLNLAKIRFFSKQKMFPRDLDTLNMVWVVKKKEKFSSLPYFLSYSQQFTKIYRNFMFSVQVE